MSPLLCSTACRLLAVLWVTARCGGVSAEPADPSAADQSGLYACSVGDMLEPFWTVVGRTVTAATQPSVARLDSRLDDVQAGLESRLEGVQTELRTQLEGVQTRLNDTVNLVRTEQAERSGELASQLSRVQAQLEARQDEVLVAAAPVRDCSDLPAGARSGVHLVRPGLGRPVPAYCDLETDGGRWTVIQRRADVQPRHDFFAGWEAYKWGLGELDAEFWWGLEHLWLTTSLLDRRHQLRINMEDFDGEKRYALYQNFRISSEADGYRLTLTNYTGDCGDSLGDRSGTRFSTKDRDHDTHADSCAQLFKGAWWYTDCHASNLNGLYLAGDHSSYADGVNWATWRGHQYSLKAVEMKIRPYKKL